MFGLDLTFKIIPRSYSPYKLMSLYSIDENSKLGINYKNNNVFDGILWLDKISII